MSNQTIRPYSQSSLGLLILGLMLTACGSAPGSAPGSEVRIPGQSTDFCSSGSQDGAYVLNESMTGDIMNISKCQMFFVQGDCRYTGTLTTNYAVGGTMVLNLADGLGSDCPVTLPTSTQCSFTLSATRMSIDCNDIGFKKSFYRLGGS